MSLFLDTLNLKKTTCTNLAERPPLWMMRQAGRYMAEYRAIRSHYPQFLDFCYTPKAATEVTLQPIRRFGFDAAILFSDILTIPDALGLDVTFVKGDGPKVEKITSNTQIDTLEKNIERVADYLSPVFEAVSSIKKQLMVEGFEKTPLIGFCGGPWTVAAYMLDEKPSKDTLNLRSLFYQDKQAFKRLMVVLVEASVAYLSRQVEAGADAIQIFDSWALSVPPEMFEDAVMTPLLSICKGLKKRHPHVPIILFPRGISPYHMEVLVQAGMSGGSKLFNGLGISHTTDLAWALDALPQMAIQGNLDPAVLLAGPEATTKAAKYILNQTKGRPGFIFNLGHGITPNTPMESVDALVAVVRGQTI